LQAHTRWAKTRIENREVVQFDQQCLNCSENVAHVSKLFKLACLAYKPNNVTYRDFEFTREQLFMMRKFLVGQAAQIVLKSTIMQKLKLNSKKLFDDVYLHIRKQIDKNSNLRDEAHEQW
jgi:hypothetical protein